MVRVTVGRMFVSIFIMILLLAGIYHSLGWGQDFPRIQILTIEELLHGAEVKMPLQFGTFKQAQKIGKHADVEQAELGFG
jgi:site-specific DNA-methyltransferase (adenine-specific)